MALKSETGNEAGGFGQLFVMAFLSLVLGCWGLSWLGIPTAKNMEWRLAEMGIASVAAFGVLILAALALHRILAVATAAGERLLAWAMETAERLTTAFIERGKRGLLFLVKLPLLPLRLLFGFAHARYIAPYLERRRQRKELRDLYEEYRDQYATFAEFLRAFYEGERAEREANGRERNERREKDEKKQDGKAKQQPDKFAAACRVMGLPENGEFTEGEFKARFRDLMLAVHPDKVGPNGFAADLNAARDLIKKRKGWK